MEEVTDGEAELDTDDAIVPVKLTIGEAEAELAIDGDIKGVTEVV